MWSRSTGANLACPGFFHPPPPSGPETSKVENRTENPYLVERCLHIVNVEMSFHRIAMGLTRDRAGHEPTLDFLHPGRAHVRAIIVGSRRVCRAARLLGERVVGGEMAVAIGGSNATGGWRRAVVVGGGILRAGDRGDAGFGALGRRLARTERGQRWVPRFLGVDGGQVVARRLGLELVLVRVSRLSHQ